MPSKLRKAIGAVKDQTSISLAKVSNNNSSNLDVAVLKATTHEDVPIDDRYVSEILILTSSNKYYAGACAHALAKRIGRTRNWIVAIKSLMIVLRIFQDGDPYFPKEVLHAMKRGAKILNLSNFRDDYNSSPWDYTAFIRTFALYLNERLECFLTGKLQRRMVANGVDTRPRKNRYNERVRDMKPVMLLDRISHWQRLLDRAIATRPTGAAKTSRLVQIALQCIVRETFDLYRDISDGLALVLDSFFHLQYESCVIAYQACIKASKQFGELSGFYIMCKDVGVGRTSEYPSVQMVSEELIDTLQEFLKDQSSFPIKASLSPQRPQFLIPGAEGTASTSSAREYGEQSESSENMGRLSDERDSEMESEYHERTVSLEDLISMTDLGSPSQSYSIISFDQDNGVEQFRPHSPQDDFLSVTSAGTSPCPSIYTDQDKQSPLHELPVARPTTPSVPFEQRSGQTLKDLFTGPISSDQEAAAQHEEQQEQPPSVSGSEEAKEGWELVLAETANTISTTQATTEPSPPVVLEPSFLDSLYNLQPTSTPINDESSYNNPFLNDAIELPTITTTSTIATASPAVDEFSAFPTFQATPTFCAHNPTDSTIPSQVENDPFAELAPSHGSVNQQHLLLEQQLWLQNQNKIIAKHTA